MRSTSRRSSGSSTNANAESGEGAASTVCGSGTTSRGRTLGTSDSDGCTPGGSGSRLADVTGAGGAAGAVTWLAGTVGGSSRNGSGIQIGRAAARERVCQYVLLSVVADSLKKNK